MKKIVMVWNQFWFTPTYYHNLCLGRIAFYLGFYYFLGDFTLNNWGNTPQEYLQPISYFKILPVSLFSPVVYAFVDLLWKGAIYACIVGLFTSISTKTLFLLALFKLGLPHNFGKIDHAYHLLVVISGILAFSRCGDFFSLDAWLRKWIFKKEIPLQSSAYEWPVKLIRTYIVLIYFEAGFQKLRVGGLGWISSENFSTLLLTCRTVTPLGLWVGNQDWLSFLLAFAGVAIQIGAPLALVHRYFAYFLIPSCFMFHIGTYALMGMYAAFYTYNIAYAFWVPWNFLILEVLGPKLKLQFVNEFLNRSFYGEEKS